MPDLDTLLGPERPWLSAQPEFHGGWGAGVAWVNGFLRECETRHAYLTSDLPAGEREVGRLKLAPRWFTTGGSPGRRGRGLGSFGRLGWWRPSGTACGRRPLSRCSATHGRWEGIRFTTCSWPQPPSQVQPWRFGTWSHRLIAT